MDAASFAWLQERCYIAQAPAVVSAGAALASEPSDHLREVDPAHLHAAAHMLRSTAGVAAAVCRADALPETCLTAYPGRPAVETDDGEAWCASRAGRRQKILVGLARVSSDQHFVGTIDEVCVLPEFQQQGLGRRCALLVCLLSAALSSCFVVTHCSHGLTTPFHSFLQQARVTRLGGGSTPAHQPLYVQDAHQGVRAAAAQ